jgi:hypothetical protein
MERLPKDPKDTWDKTYGTAVESWTGSAATNQTCPAKYYDVVKLSPHPHCPFAFGLLKINSDL